MVGKDNKNHEIQPSQIEKVSYNKNQQITKYLLLNTQAQYKAEIVFFVTEYFKTVFLKIPLGAN